MKHFSNWPWQVWAEKTPDAIGLKFEAQTYTWQQISNKVECMAKNFADQGVQRDDLVATYCHNSIEQYWLFLATLRLGARFIALNPRLTTNDVEGHIKQLNIRHFWQPEDNENIGISLSSLTLSECECKTHEPITVPVKWRSNRPATFVLTSGSSGRPKAVVHSIDNHLASAEGLLQKLPFEATDSWLLSLPLFHVSGLAIIWRCLLKGATLVIPESRHLQPEINQVSHASLVPTQLIKLLESGENKTQLKQVLLGGAAIPVSLTDKANKLGISCWSGYGMTEMASTVTAKPADGLDGVGLVLPNRELMLKEGEVLVRGDSLCMGYYRLGIILPVVNEHSWFETKDRGEIIDGQLHIHGRIDNMFKSGGEKIQPEDIEKVLLSHPEISQAFVFPIKSEQFGQRPVAVISTQNHQLTEQLSTWLEGKLVRFMHPDHYYILPERLLAGGIKPSRFQIKEWLSKQ
ncbi:o-succinylbenzoate--CoA ligase [Vibrio sp. SS-MA-C1-2]|uniref:o-succinylbenzoate--CoA ligase n=1 Tax=Vibrio sp. SS-MA-C1-2 TaxID=2908646 RepID=UPI001F461232|nr:o-succinylbenzoate--CoA ligase [Vibrio sp. SS-MA-C1-2]UJF19952.1 o-succinylbenzoate--CoA ligase [Vibrio sp. SS-MA-C1-2]